MVECFAQRLASSPARWRWGEIPGWVAGYAQACLTQVDFYRRLGRSCWTSDLPTTDRSDLRQAPERFIPDGSETTGMVYHETSGTTGTQVKIFNHPVAAECYLPLLSRALSHVGVAFEPGPDRVALMLVFHHTTTLTYPQICPVLGGAAFVRLNLHPGHWTTTEDRAPYLDFCAPQVITGTPLSLCELAKIDMKHRPKALVTTSMTLLPATRRFLEDRFNCPLVDLYSMAECRCIAARVDNGPFELLAHDVFVEILNENDQLCQPGESGEIVLTGGRNPYLPLLRYRTGDFGSMVWEQDIPRLEKLEGRAPVDFLLPDGTRRNNVEVTRALSQLPLTQFALHQTQDYTLVFRYRGEPTLAKEIRACLNRLFEESVEIDLQWTEVSLGPKWICYSSDAAPNLPAI